MKERLLKRFRSWELSESTAIVEADVNELSTSIQDDLEKVFNTRLGTVLIDDEYGLPDFSDLFNGYGSPDVEWLRLAIQKLVKKFEPRLSAVNVVHNDKVKTNNALVFSLTSQFEYKNQKLPFSINAFLHDDGSVALGR